MRLRRRKWYVNTKAPVRRTRSGARLSLTLHPPRRHLEQSLDRGRRDRLRCDDRVEGPGRYKTMTLATHEFIRRFLMHVLPKGFHRIRHYGLFANGNRAENIARACELLAMPAPHSQPEPATPSQPDQLCVLPRPCPS